MRRKSTKTTRGPDKAEKEFMRATKVSPCVVCGARPPSIVDHCLGSTFKNKKVLVGHWFVIPLCYACDKFKSTPNGSVSRFIDMSGHRLCDLWEKHVESVGSEPPEEVRDSIMSWGR
jgi:hypothetical protein